MLTKQGIPVSPGVAICTAVVLDTQDTAIPHRLVAADQVHAELGRLDRAVEQSAEQLQDLRARAADVVGEDGQPAKAPNGGFLVLKHPWPGMLRGIWGDPDRYREQYYR